MSGVIIFGVECIFLFFLVNLSQRKGKKFSGMSLKDLLKRKVKYKATNQLLFQTRQMFVRGHYILSFYPYLSLNRIMQEEGERERDFLKKSK